MERFTIQQCACIEKTFYENKPSRRFENQHKNSNCIRNLVQKFEEPGVVTDVPKSGRARKVREPTNIARIQKIVENNPRTSTRRRSQELDITKYFAIRLAYKAA